MDIVKNFNEILKSLTGVRFSNKSGTAPFEVDSNTMVKNLNAESVGGLKPIFGDTASSLMTTVTFPSKEKLKADGYIDVDIPGGQWTDYIKSILKWIATEKPTQQISIGSLVNGNVCMVIIFQIQGQSSYGWPLHCIGLQLLYPMNVRFFGTANGVYHEKILNVEDLVTKDMLSTLNLNNMQTLENQSNQIGGGGIKFLLGDLLVTATKKGGQHERTDQDTEWVVESSNLCNRPFGSLDALDGFKWGDEEGFFIEYSDDGTKSLQYQSKQYSSTKYTSRIWLCTLFQGRKWNRKWTIGKFKLGISYRILVRPRFISSNFLENRYIPIIPQIWRRRRIFRLERDRDQRSTLAVRKEVVA